LSDEEDVDAIVTAIALGRPVRQVAVEHRKPEAEVRSTVADAVKRAYDGEWLRREWALEDHRLRMVCQKYFGLAMDGEGNSTAAAIFIKASERRATVAGANAPTSYSVHLTHEAAPSPTSTDRLRSALARLSASSTSSQEEPEAPPSGPH
jgi:hypothetical protein